MGKISDFLYLNSTVSQTVLLPSMLMRQPYKRPDEPSGHKYFDSHFIDMNTFIVLCRELQRWLECELDFT